MGDRRKARCPSRSRLPAAPSRARSLGRNESLPPVSGVAVVPRPAARACGPASPSSRPQAGRSRAGSWILGSGRWRREGGRSPQARATGRRRPMPPLRPRPARAAARWRGRGGRRLRRPGTRRSRGLSGVSRPAMPGGYRRRGRACRRGSTDRPMTSPTRPGCRGPGRRMSAEARSCARSKKPPGFQDAKREDVGDLERIEGEAERE